MVFAWFSMDFCWFSMIFSTVFHCFGWFFVVSELFSSRCLIGFRLVLWLSNGFLCFSNLGLTA